MTPEIDTLFALLINGNLRAADRKMELMRLRDLVRDALEEPMLVTYHEWTSPWIDRGMRVSGGAA